MSRNGLLSHVEINVSDLKKSTDFWQWLLEYFGYHQHQKWDKGISWKKNDTYIVLAQTEDAFQEHGYHRKRTGLNHLAFHADSIEDVKAFALQLGKKCITPLYSQKPSIAMDPEYYAVYFEDPDRIKIEYVFIAQN